jgi:hypothetical protein
MKTIFKYTLDIDHVQVLEVPDGSEQLHFDIQEGKPCLWMVVDPKENKTQYEIVMLGTGWERSDEFFNEYEFIGTVQDNGFVWHFFGKEVD